MKQLTSSFNKGKIKQILINDIFKNVVGLSSNLLNQFLSTYCAQSELF